jgi:electron transfer flavoprotein alpha subunit
MSVLVYAESWEGKFKKATFEAVSYAKRIADVDGGDTIAVVFGDVSDDASSLGNYGASKVVHVSNVSTFSNDVFASALAEIASNENCDTLILSNTNNGGSTAPLLAIKAKASLVTNALALPTSTQPLTVKRKSFSSKGFAIYKSNGARNIITIIPNAIGVQEFGGSATIEDFSAANTESTLTSVSIDTAKGKIPLPEAELVISAGRGMKAPEHWNLIEELAETLNAGTACSKPVSDMGWRPHSEHVGQTGIAINPQLYIAIGISGAIQHLAGVNASKNIVVINKDPEAPFFKAADYGIVGDAFEVVPKLTAALKAYKANH